MKNINLIGIGFSLIGIIVLSTCARASAQDTGLVIYQVQTGGKDGASQEYVSIYNQTNAPIDVSNWCVIYSSASDSSNTQLVCLTPPLNARLLLEANGVAMLATTEFVQAHPGSTVDGVFNPGISGTSGHIKLLDPNKQVIDVVGWGSATRAEGSPATAHPTGMVLVRKPSTENKRQDTGDNLQDFSHLILDMPQKSGLYEEFVQAENRTVLLTELLVDPEGPDAGKEFTEFFNPNEDPVNLKGYTMLIGPAFSKSYALPDIVIEPRSYMILSDLQTGFTLPNTSASARLVAPSGIIVSETGVYNQPGENVSWAYFEDYWYLSFQPTPGEQNTIVSFKPCPEGQLRNPSSGFCRNADNDEAGAASVAPCRPDQERNPDSGRCRKLSVAATSLTACKIGQARSPETGRCRSVLSAAVTRAACKPGQTRNQTTGRCRNITASATAKSCPAGQERNTDTNRCRKVSATIGSKSLASVKDIKAALVANNIKWWAAGASAFGSIGYAAYEWRRELFRFIHVAKAGVGSGE